MHTASISSQQPWPEQYRSLLRQTLREGPPDNESLHQATRLGQLLARKGVALGELAQLHLTLLAEAAQPPHHASTTSIEMSGRVLRHIIDAYQATLSPPPAPQKTGDSEQKRQPPGPEPLKDGQTPWATLLRHMPGVVYRRPGGLDRPLSYVSERCGELTGYADHELAGQDAPPFGELVHPEDRTSVERQLGAALDTRDRFELVYRIVCRAGHTKWVWEQGRVVENSGTDPLLEGFIIDVDDHARALAALRDSEERYRSLFDRIPIALYRTTPTGELSDANPALAALFGYDNPAALAGVSVESLYLHPAERDSHLQQLNAAGVQHGVEFEARRRDGATIWVRDTARAVRDRAGTVLFYEGSLEDVTARKRAEQQLRDSEQRHRLLADAASDIVARLDPGGTTLQISPSCERILGYTPAELGSRPMLEFVHADDRPAAERTLRELLAGHDTANVTLRILHKNGQAVWLEVSADAIRDGQTGAVREILSVSRDVTARYAAEQALRRSEERLQQALRAGHMAIWEWNVVADTIYWSPEFEQLCGVAPGAFRQMYEPLRDMLHPDDRDLVEQARVALRGLQATAEPWRIEFRIVRSDGQTRWIAAQGGIIYDNQGQPQHLTGVATDVTAAKEAEAELATYRERLEHLVAARTAALEEATRRLESELAERQRVTEALRESEQRFRLVVQATQDAIYDWHVGEPRPWCSRRFRDLLGQPTPPLEDWWQQLIHPDERVSVRRSLQAALEGQTPYLSLEYRARKRDGTYGYFVERAFIIRDEAGRPTRLIGGLADLTVRREIEQLLRVQRDLAVTLSTAESLRQALKLILDAALRIEGIDAGGIYLVDEDGGLTLAHHQNLSPGFARSASYHAPGSPQARLVAQGEPVYRRFDRFDFVAERLQHEGVLALAVIPVRHEGRLITCLNLGSYTLEGLPDTTRHAVEAIASWIGAVIANMRAREALEDSERKFRALAETNPAGTVIVQDGRFHYANPAVAAVFGVVPADLVGRQFAEFVHPEQRDEVAARAARRQAGHDEPTRYELRVLDAHGTERTLDVSLATIDYEGRPAILGAAIDITERKRAEEALQETRERLELALSGADLATWDYDCVTGDVIVNDRWAEIFGYAPAELPPGVDAWVSRIHPDDRARVLDVWEAHLAGRTPSYEAEHRIRHRSGRWIWLLARGRAVARADDGRPLRVSGTNLDITARKEAEAQARQRQEELFRVSRLSTVGEMATGLAHEMAQPLQAIVFYAQSCLARLRDAEPSPEDLRIGFERVSDQAERAGNFIRWLKRFVRKAPPNRQPCDINEVIREAVQLAVVEAHHHHAKITLRLADTLPPVDIDRVQIEQVLLNLVRNAMEAMDDLPGPDREVTIETRAVDDRRLRVAVHDRGPGIAAADQQRVFDAFFSTKGSGTGLGLSISHSIIERHDGTLSFETKPGRDGTVFFFELPVLGDAQPRSEE